MGDDDVNVGAGAHGARLEERLLEEDALAVDVEARLHVVEGVAHLSGRGAWERRGGEESGRRVGGEEAR